MFWRLRSLPDGTSPDRDAYEELGPELWSWDRITEFHLKGEFAKEEVDSERLLEILLHHLDRIEDDLRKDVIQAVRIVGGKEAPDIVSRFGQSLLDHEEVQRKMKSLYQRKLAEVAKASERAVIEEMVTQAALNYLNKVFFLNLCEERNLPGFYRILREFLPDTKATTTDTTAVVFLGLLRRRINDAAAWRWDKEEEDAYRSLRSELANDIREHVIDQNNWSELIRVAFDLAQEEFPLVYRDDAYDYFRPAKETVAELVYDLSTKSFVKLTNEHVGNIYQGLLSSRRSGAEGKSGRQAQQATLGAFYTPQGDVDYMVSKLNLSSDSLVLDPCMGSGRFLEGIYTALLDLRAAEGIEPAKAHSEIVSEQIYGGDVDTFATSLAAIRMFLLDEWSTRAKPNLYVHDMLLHTPERPGAELFTFEVFEAEGKEKAEAELAVSSDRDVDDCARSTRLNSTRSSATRHMGRKPDYKKPIYARLYGSRAADLKLQSSGTGDADTYSMFFVSSIERLREGGRLCLITNDSFRTLTTHRELRRHILDRCRIVEILLTDTDHFEGVSFKFAGLAITTLEKCSDEKARKDNTMRLVDFVREPESFSNPPPELVTELRQEEYEALPETPFFVGVPTELFEAASRSNTVGGIATGRQGLATADDNKFLAGVGSTFSGLEQTINGSQLAGTLSMDEREKGIRQGKPHWVPFAKGEGFGEYWRDPHVAINWSVDSVGELSRRDKLPPKTPRKPRFQNRDFYFKPGLTYSVISSGRISVRLMPEGWVFGHKGSAIFVDDPETSELFLLGYLNSALATYFMKKIFNTTATADIGYIEKLPFRRPSKEIESAVIKKVDAIVAALKADPDAEIDSLRAEIDDLIFDLFEIGESRQHVLDFYAAIGKVATEPDEEAQAANE